MRKYFLGGNTPKGFFSYYDYLIRQSEARKIYVIKGGPGTGKSTLMKKIAAWAEEEGYGADYIYCSSDPDSLDGLVIPEMKIAMVDGTAPHIVDPKTPGAVDTIVHLGNLWNEGKMRKNKEEILDINHRISEKFALAYEHLAAAGVLYGTTVKLKKRMLDIAAVENAADELIFKEIKDISQKGSGFRRKLFASAFCPLGYISHAKSLPSKKRYLLRGNGAEVLIERVAKAFTDNCYDTELFYNPLMPDSEILHIYVPELDLGIFTEEITGSVPTGGSVVVDLQAMTDKYIFEEYAEELENCRQALSSQTEQACNVIKSAKALHDKLEGCYIPNMDFAGINKVEEKIISELEDMK